MTTSSTHTQDLNTALEPTAGYKPFMVEKEGAFWEVRFGDAVVLSRCLPGTITYSPFVTYWCWVFWLQLRTITDSSS